MNKEEQVMKQSHQVDNGLLRPGSALLTKSIGESRSAVSTVRSISSRSKPDHSEVIRGKKMPYEIQTGRGGTEGYGRLW